MESLLNTGKTLISTVELKRLLIELKDKQPNTCLRFRLLGEMWKHNFFRIVRVDDNGVFLRDDNTLEIVSISDLSAIMQFEIDQKFQVFQPHFHYDVRP